MKWGLFIGEAVVWVLFVYYFLFTLKSIAVGGMSNINLWTSAIILVVLCYLALFLCPWFRETSAYKRMLSA